LAVDSSSLIGCGQLATHLRLAVVSVQLKTHIKLTPDWLLTADTFIKENDLFDVDLLAF